MSEKMPRSRKIADDVFDIFAVAAAHLRSDGEKQQDIAKKLGISQPDVSRLLEHAIDRAWLESHPSFISNQESDALWDEAQKRFFAPEGLKSKLKQWAPSEIDCNVTIIHTEEGATFARAAASRVIELVVNDSRIQNVGILYGRTIDNVVRGIEEKTSGNHPRKGHPLKFTPLCGEPIYLVNLQNLRHSASSLASRLSAAINGSGDKHRSDVTEVDESPSLAGVPVYISTRKIRPGNIENQARAKKLKRKSQPKIDDQKAVGQETETIRKFFCDIPGYARIFGPTSGNKPMIDQLDAIITGLGVIDRKQPDYAGAFLRERVAQNAASLKELNELVFGDIGGILLPRSNLSPDAKSRVAEMNRDLTGIKEDQMKRVASQPGMPGVIVIATGESKAEMTREAIAQGFVTHLIISLPLANAIQALDK